MGSADVRIPPQSIEAEKSILGAMLTNEEACDSVTSIVKTEDFYRDAHRIIYDALLKIVHKNKRADFVLLVEELERENKLEAVGGVAYITSLANDTSAATYNIEEHARLVAEKAQMRRLIDAGNKIVGMTYEGKDEPSNILNQAEQMILSVSGSAHGESSFANMTDVVQDILNRLNEMQQMEGTMTGLATGFRDLDAMTNGLQKSDLILVAARPSMGKTAFTLNIAQNVALRSHKSVAFFSLEMSAAQLGTRILSSVAEVSSEKLRTGNLSLEEWERVVKASEIMSKSRLYIDDTPGLTPQMMRTKLRRLKVEHGLDLVVLDYVQLMQGRSGSSNSDNRQQEISEISRNLKLIAREFDVPFIALSQLSRGVESRTDKRPVLSDLRESGSLEQDADIVAFLYRDKYYNPDNEHDITEVLVRKHRNGSLGMVELLFQGELTRFRDTTRGDREEE